MRIQLLYYFIIKSLFSFLNDYGYIIYSTYLHVLVSYIIMYLCYWCRIFVMYLVYGHHKNDYDHTQSNTSFQSVHCHQLHRDHRHLSFHHFKRKYCHSLPFLFIFTNILFIFYVLLYQLWNVINDTSKCTSKQNRSLLSLNLYIM